MTWRHVFLAGEDCESNCDQVEAALRSRYRSFSTALNMESVAPVSVDQAFSDERLKAMHVSKLSQYVRRAGLVTLAVAIMAGVLVFSAHSVYAADANNCATLYTTKSGLPTGFGTNLGSMTFNGHTFASCSNGYGLYWSGETNAYGVPFQCTEMVRRYDSIVWGDNLGLWTGNASNFWWAHPSRFTTKPNGSAFKPRVGDILVWGPVTSGGAPDHSQTGNIPGHVAILKTVTQVDGFDWTVTVFNQNIDTGHGGQFSTTSGYISEDDVTRLYTMTISNFTVSSSSLYGVLDWS